MLKIAAVVLIIFAGVIGAYIIINTPNLSSVSNTGVSSENEDNQLKPSVEWFDRSQSFISDKLSDLGSFFADTKNTVAQSVDNPSDATKQVSTYIFNKLKNLDEQGQNPFQNLDLNNLSDSESQKLIEDAVNSIQNPMLLSVSTIDNSQLKILLNNSKEAKTTYLENIQKITKERFSDPKYQRTSEQLINNINNDCFIGEQNSLNREFSKLYGNLVNDYLGLAVPSDWVDIHKKMIIYFKKANLVYRDLADCFKDPIRGYVALWALPQLIREGQEIQTSLDNLIKAL